MVVQAVSAPVARVAEALVVVAGTKAIEWCFGMAHKRRERKASLEKRIEELEAQIQALQAEYQPQLLINSTSCE